MTILKLLSRLQYLERGGVPVPLHQPNPFQWVTSRSSAGDLKITVNAHPSGNQHPRNPQPLCAPQPVELPLERAGPSQKCVPVPLGLPPTTECQSLHRRVSQTFFGNDVSAVLPPSGTIALSELDPEMTAMLSWAAEIIGLMWNPSRLEVWFLETANGAFLSRGA